MALEDHIPLVERSPWGILCLVLNIIPGGVGTIIAGAKTDDTKNIIFGVIQLLLAAAVIGWIWSLVWGIMIFTKSTEGATRAKAAPGA